MKLLNSAGAKPEFRQKCLINEHRERAEDKGVKMGVKITEGKFKGLMALANSKGMIAAAAMDQRGSLQKSIAKAKGVDAKQISRREMEEFKAAVSKILTPYATAI